MSEGKILPAITTDFGHTVIKMTKNNLTAPFWEFAEEHLISVVGLYVASEKKLTGFIEILTETYDLLKYSGGWNTLSALLLDTKDSELKEILIKDALFHTEEGWELKEEQKNNIVLLGSLNRLQALIEDLV